MSLKNLKYIFYMKKILFMLSFILTGYFVKAQSLQPSDFKNDANNRPNIDRIFKTADNGLSLIYYVDGTVSFYNNSKYTDRFLVHNFVNPYKMMIVREDLNNINDILFYSEANQSYTDNISGRVYIVDPSSIRQRLHSND